jgi:hypothetical protein
MAKYFASDRRAVEVQIEGARTGTSKTLRADRKGFYEAEGRDAKALEQSGFVQASLMGPRTGGGFNCAGCGFGSWFKTCSRCGTVN